MSLKYRIRLQNERVIGPFSSEEIGELFLKGHIEGNESCQQFPIGDWRALQSFPSLKQLIEALDKKNLKDPTLTRPSEKSIKVASENTSSGIKAFKEFQFGKDVKIDVNYEELEKKYKEENPDYVGEDGLEKTRIIRKSVPKPKIDMDKTVVRPMPAAAKVEKVEEPVVESLMSKAKAQAQIMEEAKNFVPPEPTMEELVNEKTEFINLKSALPTINAQLSVSEVEFEKQAKIEENKEKRKQKELQVQLIRQANEEDEDEEDEEDEVVIETIDGEKDDQPKVVKKKKKKGMSLIVAIAFAALFYVIMTPDEAPAPTGPQYVEVKFPIQAGPDNTVEANKFLVQGRDLYGQNNYLKRAEASGQFLNSLQMKFSNNEAMGDIILSYAEMLDDTKDKNKSANTLYKFIQISENRVLSEPAIATGTALFFGNIGKPFTGINTIKNYLRAGGKPTPKMLSYYLRLLVQGGDLVEARKVYESLNKISKKPFEAYNELAKFQLVNANPAEAKTILNEGLKYYPQSVLLLISLADILLKEQAVKEYEVVLNKITALKSESSPSYVAAYLKHMGYLYAFKEDNKTAANYFKKSLLLKESDDLRMMLARLEISGDKLSQTLITESKVIGLLEKAKAEHKNRNTDSAFAFAIEAVDALPNYVPAVLFLAELNAERGLFDAAIVSLERAIAENPQNNQLKKMLVEVYLKSYKLDEAEKNLTAISQTKFANTPDYFSLMGQFAEARKNTNIALRWYNEALKINPLNDADMFRIAKILVRSKKFPEAKGWISKAVFLDPKNINYLALNSEVLYEQDGTDTAIGYLRDIMADEGEDPILVSTIAMTYYKSGQIKEFQAYYKKVQDLPKKDERLYEFLIGAAKLEGRKDEFITYSKEAIKLNPGSLMLRMNLGEFYLEEKRLNDAIDEFEEIRARLDSYPKVHYYLAKVYLAKGDMKKAAEMADKELKLNPALDTAYFIVGEVHRLNKEYREAITKYEKAISLNPRSVDALIAMGWIRLNQNYASESIELFNRALKEEPTNPLIHKNMGDAYRAAGQRALAKEKYEDYLKLSPGAEDKSQIESLIRNLQ